MSKNVDLNAGTNELHGASGSGRQSLFQGMVLGHHRIIKLLGRGGMGDVYLAEHVHMGKRYALKVLSSELSSDQQFISRFKIEARVMADLEHPNIVRVHHMGEENGVYYLVMGYVGGVDDEPETLEDMIASVSPEGIPSDKVRGLTLQILSALSYAHGRGVVHRDLKPSNVLHDGDDRVLVSDFGLAKVVGDSYQMTAINRTVNLVGTLSFKNTEGGKGEELSTSMQSWLGTYDYMSPEQKAGGKIDARSDIYAFGLILYRMLTGRKPEGRFHAPSSFGCHPGWNKIVQKCLEPEPADRYANADALKTAIETGIPFKSHRAFGSSRWLLAVSVFLAVAAAVWFSGLMQNKFDAIKPISEVPTIEHPMIVSGPREVAILKAQVEQEWNATEEARQLLVPSKELIEKASLNLQAASNLFEAREWGEAKRMYSEVLEDCSSIMALRSAWASACSSRSRAESARNVLNTQLKKDGGEDWQAAEQMMLEAVSMFDSGDYQAAAAKWESARNGYIETQSIAENVGKLRIAQKSFEQAMAKADTAGLEKFGGDAWSSVAAARRLGEDDSLSVSARIVSYEEALRGLAAAEAQAVVGQKDESTKKGLLATAREDTLKMLRSYNQSRLMSNMSLWTNFVAHTNRGESVAASWDERRGAYVSAMEILRKLVAATDPSQGDKAELLLGGGPNAQSIGFVWVPNGSFDMGSVAGSEEERPVRRVVLSRGFWMSAKEVTQEQWQYVMSTNPSVRVGAGLPVENVTWYDCQDFLNKINDGLKAGSYKFAASESAATSIVARLPTEAQWEYTCRAGTTNDYFFGNDAAFLGKYGNYCDKSVKESYVWKDTQNSDGFPGTAPVGSFDPNPWGLFDVHGNVWEWCQDRYSENYYSVGDDKDPQGPGDEDLNPRVIRGGCWRLRPQDCRSAARTGSVPRYKDETIGLRIAGVPAYTKW